MKGFAALLRLQLLSRLADLKPKNLRQNFAKNRAKTLGMIAAYIFLAVWLIGFLVFIENAALEALIPLGMADLLLSLTVTASMMSTLVLAFFFIMSSLYFGRDSAFLAALPVKPRTVLSAKLAQVWLSETGVSALFILPAGILYGIRMGEGALFYVRMLLVLFGVAVLPIAAVTLVSTVLIRLSALWKRRETVATVGGIVLLGAYMYFCMSMGSMMPDQPQDFLADFFSSNQTRILALTRAFPPAAWAANGLNGEWGELAIFLLVCAAAAAGTIYLVGGVYRKLSLLQTETPTRRRKSANEKGFSQASVFGACCKREITHILRVPTYAVNILPLAFMPVFMVVMMAVTLNRTASPDEVNMTQMLSELDGGVVVAVLAALMAFMAGINPALSTAVTREGRGHDFLMALPLSARTAVMAKMAVGLALSIVGCGVAAAVLIVLMPQFAVHALLAFLACVLYCYLSGAISLANDVSHPKLDWLTETEAIKQKSGTLVGILVSWGILIALGIASYLVLSAGVGMAVYTAALLLLLALGAMLAHLLLMRAADTKYCQG